MERKISTCESSLFLWCILPEMIPNVYDWIPGQAKIYGLRWLIAHTDSGVVWGEMRNGTLHLSCDTNAFANRFVGVALDWNTLQQCRLFGQAGELLLWQTKQRWQARLQRDDAKTGTMVQYLDEEHLVWGTRQEDKANDFVLLAEGSQGIYHAPPLLSSPTETCRAALLVRHYLTQEPDTGLLHITASRLVALLEPGQRVCHRRSTGYGEAS